jgi:hypothetical protein
LLEPWADLIAGVHLCFAAGAVALHLGSLALTLDEPGRAEAHFRAALARQDPVAAPYWGGRAQLGLARVLRDRGGGSAEAEELIGLAVRAADEHGLGGLNHVLAALALGSPGPYTHLSSSRR